MSGVPNKMDELIQESKNFTNNFTNNTILNNSFSPANNMESQNGLNQAQSIQPKLNFPFPYMVNPVLFNNPNFKQMYPQMYQNTNLQNMNNNNNNQNVNQNQSNAANTNGNNNIMKMPVMGIPVFFSPLMFGTQDQTPVLERYKIWVGKIPEGISETFMKKLLDCCGQVTSWKRVTNSSGKLNSFGFCEYSTVESILKCLRLLNGYPLLGSELQVKIGNDTEEFLKRWRERKKIEWINSMAIQGIPVNLEEIKRKEENGEPLEWELRLVANDQEILKTINEVVSKRQEIDNTSKKGENDIFLKDLNDFANSNILENPREKERKKKKLEKIKKYEKLFNDFEKNWLKHESYVEKERNKLLKEKENWPKKREKLIEKDLEYDSDKEKKFNEGLKGLGNKGYKISASFINKKRNEERIKLREKEREYDNALREKENQMLFKNIEQKDNYLLENDNLINLLETKELLPIGEEEKKPQTTFVIEDYNANSNTNENISKEKHRKESIKEEKPKENPKVIEKKEDDKYKEEKQEKEIKENNNEEEKENINEEIQEEINIDKMSLEQLLSGIPESIYIEIQKNIKNIIPNKTDELFSFKIDWDLITKYELKRKKIKKFIEKKLLEYFDDVDAFTKFILEKLGVLTPNELKEKLKYVIDKNTEVSIYLILT